MLAPGAPVPASRSRLRGVEVEVAFLIAHDLPSRASFYTREEISAAVASVHPAIEIVESALLDPSAVPPLLKSADLQINGGFVYGPAFAESNWPSIDWTTETASLIVNGSIRLERTASNTAGTDLLRLLQYVANEGSVRTGGLHKGQWVTTGSWTGLSFCNPGDHVEGRFTGSSPARLTFE
jgi:2-keto-4-pentenoate hydratase